MSVFTVVSEQPCVLNSAWQRLVGNVASSCFVAETSVATGMS